MRRSLSTARSAAQNLRRDRVAFLRGVAEDENTAARCTPNDLAGAEERLRMFLENLGPTNLLERGHPRLRMRHAPFRISLIERDAPGCGACIRQWPPSTQKRSMTSTVERLLDYLEMAARPGQLPF